MSMSAMEIAFEEIKSCDGDVWEIIQQARLAVLKRAHFDFVEYCLIPIYCIEDRSFHIPIHADFNPFLIVNGLMDMETGRARLNYKIECRRVGNNYSWIEIKIISAQEAIRLDCEYSKKAEFSIHWHAEEYTQHLARGAVKPSEYQKQARKKANKTARASRRKSHR